MRVSVGIAAVLGCASLLETTTTITVGAFSPIVHTSSRSFTKASRTTFLFASADDDDDADEKKDAAPPAAAPVPQPVAVIKPDILLPFAAAADPDYMNTGPIDTGDFIVSRTGEPNLQELSNENLLKILYITCSDLQVNTVIWKCLGYRFDIDENKWTAEKVFPKWKEKFPTPPDLIGMQRLYEKEVDQPVLKANQSLVRSVPVDNKQSLKVHLKPLGFSGYKYAELTPNKTRRAQCANWLLFYREELFGYTIDELKERRAAKKAAEVDDGEWKPPVTEVY